MHALLTTPLDLLPALFAAWWNRVRLLAMEELRPEAEEPEEPHSDASAADGRTQAAGEPPGEEPEAGWMRRVAAGDEAALQQLFDRWKLPLLSYFYRSLGSRAEAEDLALEVFVRLHRAAPDYRPTARFSTFLFQIARNLMLNELRRRRRKPAEALPPEAFDTVAEAAAEESRGLRELEEVLQAALTRLPEKLRTPLLLLHQQGLSYPEAAGTLRITENALRVTVFRARRKLRELMEVFSGQAPEENRAAGGAAVEGSRTLWETKSRDDAS